MKRNTPLKLVDKTINDFSTKLKLSAFSARLVSVMPIKIKKLIITKPNTISVSNNFCGLVFSASRRTLLSILLLSFQFFFIFHMSFISLLLNIPEKIGVFLFPLFLLFGNHYHLCRILFPFFCLICFKCLFSYFSYYF